MYQMDMEDIKGHESARRAIEVAVAGRHNIMMFGLPGSGRTMMARRITTLFSAETQFRAPHHTISVQGLVGGGVPLFPGEVTRAHNGVLFLDEFQEFRKSVLECLKTPVSERAIVFTRNGSSITMPCDFMLVAAMDWCPCGKEGDHCTCAFEEVKRHWARVNAFLRDYFDVYADMWLIPYKQYINLPKGESSAAVLNRIKIARNRQLARFAGEMTTCNSGIATIHLKDHCVLEPAAVKALEDYINEYGVDAKGFDKTLRVARTVADLADAENISLEHIEEAIQLRVLPRKDKD